MTIKVPRWAIWVVALVAAAYSFMWPPTRAVWIWLWPIDPGHEDTVTLVGIVVVLWIAFMKGWISLPKFLSRRKRK